MIGTTRDLEDGFLNVAIFRGQYERIIGTRLTRTIRVMQTLLRRLDARLELLVGKQQHERNRHHDRSCHGHNSCGNKIRRIKCRPDTVEFVDERMSRQTCDVAFGFGKRLVEQDKCNACVLDARFYDNGDDVIFGKSENDGCDESDGEAGPDCAHGADEDLPCEELEHVQVGVNAEADDVDDEDDAERRQKSTHHLWGKGRGDKTLNHCKKGQTTVEIDAPPTEIRMLPQRSEERIF